MTNREVLLEVVQVLTHSDMDSQANLDEISAEVDSLMDTLAANLESTDAEDSSPSTDRTA